MFLHPTHHPTRQDAELGRNDGQAINMELLGMDAEGSLPDTAGELCC